MDVGIYRFSVTADKLVVELLFLGCVYAACQHCKDQNIEVCVGVSQNACISRLSETE